MARLLSPLRLAAAGVVLLAVVLVVLVTRGSNQYLEVPDQAHPLQGLVQVPGAKPPKNGGDIYYVDVLLRPASLLESWVPAVRPEGSDIIARTQIVEPGISDKERFQLDLATMKVSQEVASVVALRQLGYHVPIRPDGVRVVAVTSGSHAAKLVRPGDVIVAADGKPVRTRTDLAAALSRHKPGDVVNLVIRRGGRKSTVSVRTTSDRQDPKRPIIGVLPIQALHIQLRLQGRSNRRDRARRIGDKNRRNQAEDDRSAKVARGRLPRPGRWGQRQGREALCPWPEDHPCEDFSTGVARAGNTSEKGLSLCSFRQDRNCRKMLSFQLRQR